MAFQLHLTGQDSLNISKIYNWQDTSLPSSIIHDNRYNEIWGFAQDNREYAIIGSCMGTHFFDVTDPAHSVQVDFVEGVFTGEWVVHRDYHDFDNYLYMVCDEGPSTLQIVDLTYLPDSVHLVYNSDTLFSRVHNIFIDSSKARLYACSVKHNSLGYNALTVYDLNNPLDPKLIFSWNEVSQVHDAFIRNDTCFLNAGNEGLHILNLSDTANPEILGVMDFYPEQGYNHSGWLDRSGQYYVFADETHGMGMKLYDLSDPSSLELKSIFNSGIDTNSIPHNLIIKDDFVYVSYYHDGLYIFDISDPANPVVEGYYDTYLLPDHERYRGAWGVYPFLPSGNVLVSDMQSGLFIFKTGMSLQVEKPNRDEGKLTINPNPAADYLNISLGLQNETRVDIELIDVQGRRILQKSNYPLNGHTVLTMPEHIFPGIYFINVSTKEKTYTQLFIKK